MEDCDYFDCKKCTRYVFSEMDYNQHWCREPFPTGCNIVRGTKYYQVDTCENIKRSFYVSKWECVPKPKKHWWRKEGDIDE